MGLFWSNSWSLDLNFCTHAKKNETFNLSKFGGQIQHIFLPCPIFSRNFIFSPRSFYS